MTPTRAVVSSERGISSTVAWGMATPDGRIRATYALEGNILCTGAGVQWLGQLLGLADPGRDIEALAAHGRAIRRGLFRARPGRAWARPIGASRRAACSCGLTRGQHDGAPGARLAGGDRLPGARRLRGDGERRRSSPLSLLLADGGASRNDLLMQFQADIIGRPVQRSDSPDLSALGAAYLAGLATGLWRTEAEIEGLAQHGRRFEPHMDRRRASYAVRRLARGPGSHVVRAGTRSIGGRRQPHARAARSGMESHG